jgi:hypothetical protein
MISLQKNLIRNSEITWRMLDDEVFIIDQAGEEIIALNKTASYIWEMTSENIAISEILKRICHRFDIDEKTALADLTDLINEMLKKQIITINGQPQQV